MHIWELGLHVTFDVVSNSSKVNTKVRTLFLNKKFRDFQGHISHFSRTPSSAKSALSLALPQHEQFYPEGLSCQVQSLGWIKLAPKFKDFPVSTAIFKDFQGPGIFILKFQGLSWTFKMHTNPAIPLPCLLQATLSLDVCIVSKLPCCHSS